MHEEDSFLHAILSSPEDKAARLVYADWLEERGDPRANFVRSDPGLERMSYVAWLEKDGHLDYYLENFPEVKRQADERNATESLRNQRRALAAACDPEWVAFMNTFGCSFEPFLFFNNHGNPRELEPHELPFSEHIGTRGGVVTFASAFRKTQRWDAGLTRDLEFLSRLELQDCWFGAATCPVHPFICELTAERRPLFAADIIAALNACHFRSEHIPTLDAPHIAYPGYRPGTENDEIHNDFHEQYIFQNPKDEDDENAQTIDEFSGTHGKLKRYVADGQLWYVLLHTTPESVEEFEFSRYVILFAVGRTPHADRLVGVVTHQVCHNLCD